MPGPRTFSASRATFFPCDVTDSDGFTKALAAAAEHGQLRAVVHCAGRGGDRVRIIDKERRPGDLDTFTEVLRINLIGTYNVLRLAAAVMSGNDVVDGDRGAVVLTASVAAFEGQIGQTSYTAAKAGSMASPWSPLAISPVGRSGSTPLLPG